MPQTPQPTFETESLNRVVIEVEVQLDEWKPSTPEEIREILRRLPPPWNTFPEPPAPQPPTE